MFNFLPGDAIWQQIAIEHKNLLNKRVGTFWALAIMIQLINPNGWHNSIIFLLPNIPPNNPPTGVKGIPICKQIESLKCQQIADDEYYRVGQKI